MPRQPKPPDDAVAAPIAAALGIDDDPADFEPSAADLVIADPFDRNETMMVLDRHDEQLMLQELQGRVIKELLYRFPGEDGVEIVDLSYQGVNECIRVMVGTGKVRIKIDPNLLRVESATEDVGNGAEPCWIATVYAHEARTDYGQFGTFVQSKRMYLTASKATYRKNKRERAGKPHGVADDNSVANPFARQTCLNKAQRNALRTMIPEGIRQALIAQYVGDTDRIRTIEVGAGARTLADLPPALTDDRADAQRKEIKRVYDVLHARDPMAILPAQLHAYTIRAEWSHDRLDELIQFLKDKCAQVGAEVPDA